MKALRKAAENFRVLTFSLVLIFEAKCVYVRSVIRLCMHLACTYRPTSNVVIVLRLINGYKRNILNRLTPAPIIRSYSSPPGSKVPSLTGRLIS